MGKFGENFGFVELKMWTLKQIVQKFKRDGNIC